MPPPMKILLNFSRRSRVLGLGMGAGESRMFLGIWSAGGPALFFNINRIIIPGMNPLNIDSMFV